MSQERLKLTTKKSLYAPIEIEIDGEVYQSVKMTRNVRIRMGELNDKIQIISAGKQGVEALYKFIQLVFNVDEKTLEKLEQREVEDIYLYTTRRFSEIEKERLDIVKNTIQKTWQTDDKQEPKKTVPKNRKRPGG